MNNIVGDNMINEPILKKRKNKSRNLLAVIFSIGFIVLVVGISYAFFVYEKEGVYTHTISGGKIGVTYNEDVDNNIHIENSYPLTNEQALTRGLEFEFSVTGFNENNQNAYYAVELVHGEDISGKNRFLDTDMKISLYENDVLVLENMIFDNLDGQFIFYGQIPGGIPEENPITNNYKIRLWINDNVMITDTPEAYEDTGKKLYSSDEFQNSYANFKVNIKTSLTYENAGFLTYDSKGGIYTPEKTSVTTGKVTLQKPIMEGKGFLGWSTTENGEVEYKPGDTYVGEGRVLYAVYSDVMNVMGDLSAFESNKSTITEVYFIDDSQANIDARYNAATTKTDLTLDNQGSVKGWLEDNKLYIGSDGYTYLSAGTDLFNGNSALTSIDFTNVDTGLVTDMQRMFANCENLTSLDLSNFNTYGVTSVGDMFNACTNLTTLDVSSFDTDKVENMSGLFRNCTSLQNIDLSDFDTSNVTDMNSMFYGCKALTSLDMGNGLDTGNVNDMKAMFFDCLTLTILDLSSFNTSNVTDMGEMFDGCGKLTNIELGNSFKTDKVTDMNRMFMYCRSLTNLDLNGFDTKNVTSMNRMFYDCSGLKDLDLSNFVTSNVTDMSFMFYNCAGLNSLDLSNFNTGNVTLMNGMFYNCTGLTSLNVSSFNTSNVTDMSRMFSVCSKLTQLILVNFNTSNVTNFNNMFNGSTSLITIYCNSDWKSGSSATSGQMFLDCTSLIGAISYSSTKINATYANPDTGYFTRKTA